MTGDRDYNPELSNHPRRSDVGAGLRAFGSSWWCLGGIFLRIVRDHRFFWGFAGMFRLGNDLF